MPGKDTSLITDAALWASSLWDRAHSRWTARAGQDIRYRTNVIHPALASILRELYPAGGMHILDIGCGDGVFLDSDIGKEVLAEGGSYTGVDISAAAVREALSRHTAANVSFIEGDAAAPAFPDRLFETGVTWSCVLSVFTLQEIADLASFAVNLERIVPENGYAVLVAVHPDFADWLRENGRMETVEEFAETCKPHPRPTVTPSPHEERATGGEVKLQRTPGGLWRWAGAYPIVDEPKEPFPLPYFHRTLDDYRDVFTTSGFTVKKVIEAPEPEKELPRLVREGISPFTDFETNLYWPRIAEAPSSLVFVLERKRTKKRATRRASRLSQRAVKTASHTAHVPFRPGEQSYMELRDRFMDIIHDTAGADTIRKFTAPARYDNDRVTYIIPPITDVGQRSAWKPENIYIVESGVVAIGRVFYTRTSGEFLVEELILRHGDIFGEFEVPLSILGSPALWGTKLPPRFNMTYGAWASGPALNWAMAYPRYIPRDMIEPGNPTIAVHPFYIKSKDIRPTTDAEIYGIPIEHFEHTVSEHPDALNWFLMNVLWKNRLYFEPPAQGYGRSPEDAIARLMIRILAYRIRLGLVVLGSEGERVTCRTFIGPAEWLKHGLGLFATELMEVVRSVGGSPRETLTLPVFGDELADIIEVTYHYPVKDIDDEMLAAMGCSPEEDRGENRYGLLTGIRIDLSDLDRFKKYLLEKGE